MGALYYSFCKAVTLCGVCAFSCGIGAKEACPDKVRVAFPDFAAPPFLNGDGPEFQNPPGYFVDWTKQAMETSGCPIQLVLQRQPYRRSYAESKRDSVDFIGVAPYQSEREVLLQFPLFEDKPNTHLMFYRSQLSLWVRKDDNTIFWDGAKLIGPPGFKVGAPGGAGIEMIAKKNGWEVEYTLNGPNAVENLLNNRISVIGVTDLVVNGLPQIKRDAMRQLMPKVDDRFFYSAPTHLFYQKYPEFVQRFWLALCRASREEKALPEQRLLPRCS